MTGDSYQTIFELGFRSFPWLSVIQPLIFLVLGLLFITLLIRMKSLKRKTFYLSMSRA
jgi:hypothetical protein